MAILSKGINFSTGEQVTADKLDALVDSATFVGGAVDNSTTQLSGGAIIVKDSGITTNKIASGVNISFSDGSVASPSITNNGNTNTGIYFPSDNQVGISSAGIATAHLYQSGSYGTLELAGTNGAFIDLVAGTINSPDFTTRLLATENFMSIVSATSIPFYIATNNTERLRVTGSGDVGIGTESPSTKLDVNGAVNVTGGITVSDGVRGGMRYGALLTTDGNQTSMDLTGIPNWARRITAVFRNLKTNGTAFKQFQLGNSSGYATTIGGMTEFTSNTTLSSTISTGLGLRSDLAADILHGTAVFTLLHGSTWVGNVSFSLTNTGAGTATGGGIGNCYLETANVDRIRLTTVGGANTFDSGTALGIYYEG